MEGVEARLAMCLTYGLPYMIGGCLTGRPQRKGSYGPITQAHAAVSPRAVRAPDRNQPLLDLYARHAADLIERLRSDEALRESEWRFARFMECAPSLSRDAARHVLVIL
jgi:hypothetical protein